MESRTPLVYILVLNYNNLNDTAGCLLSLQDLAYPNFKVILVDNASTGQGVATLKEQFPWVEFIQNDSNLGFAGGNNVGIQQALNQGAEYVCLLNNDTVVAPDFLNELVKTAQETQAGVWGPKIYYHYDPELIWFAGGFINWLTGDVDHLGLNQREQGQFEKVREVDFVTGCCLLIKRKVIEEIGFLDENYFLYFEDVDWCLRAGRVGYKNLYVPGAKVWHKVSSTMGGMSPLAYYYITRNRFYFFKKHLGKIGWLLLLPILYLRVLKSLAGVLLRRKEKQAGLAQIFRGVRDYLRSRWGAFPCG